MILIPFLTAFFGSLALSTVLLALPLLAIDKFGAGNYQLGLLVAASAVPYTAMALLSGHVTERVPIRAHLVTALFTLAAMAFLMPLAPTFPLLVATNAVMGTSMGLLWAPLESVVSRLSKPGQIRLNSGRYNTSWSVGMTLGFFSVPLVERWAHLPLQDWAFSAGSALLLATGAMLLFLRAPNAQRFEPPIELDPTAPRSDVRRRFFLLTAWSGLFVAYVGVGAARNLFPKLATELAISDGTIGLIYGVGLTVQSVTMGVMGRWGGWHYRRRVVPLGEVGLVIAGVLILLGRTPLVFSMGHMVLGVSMAVLYSASLYYSMQDPVDAHRNTSVHEAIIGTAMAVPLLLGKAADAFQYTPLSFGAAATLALVLFAVHVAWSRATFAAPPVPVPAPSRNGGPAETPNA